MIAFYPMINLVSVYIAVNNYNSFSIAAGLFVFVYYIYYMCECKFYFLISENYEDMSWLHINYCWLCVMVYIMHLLLLIDLSAIKFKTIKLYTTDKTEKYCYSRYCVLCGGGNVEYDNIMYLLDTLYVNHL